MMPSGNKGGKIRNNYEDQASMKILYLEFTNCITKNNRVQNLSEL